MQTQTDVRQLVWRAAGSMIGSAAGDTLDTILAKIDPELGKLFEDRNILLTDGGTITFTGTQVQFTDNLNITLNQKISGAVPQVISLGSTSQNFVSSGDMWVAVLNRTAGTATTSIITAGNPLPAATATNQEVFLIAKRVDAGDGTQRLYWRNGFAMNAGQTLRLGQGGGSGGSGLGDDLDSLLFRASFTDLFAEADTNSNSSINATGTNSVFNAAKNMYAISYDASKTVTGSTTNMTLSGTPGFTVAIGDVLIVGTEARKITTVTSQTIYVIESAFTVTPSPSAAAATISQAIHTKDIYNLAVDGAALSAGFPATTFSEIMVIYKDNATSGSNLFTPDVAPVVGWVGSNDLTNFTLVQKRSTNITDTDGSAILPSSGSNLYLRFFANKSSGSGTVNLLMYKTFLQKVTSTGSSANGGILWSAYAMSNSSTTAVNCTLSVVGGKTTITLTNGNQYAVGVNSTQTYGSVDVYVNGQLFPRFLAGSVPTSDGSYTETSSTVITLDRDYSSQALEIQVVQRSQIVDASTTNTTSISAQQEIMQNGFQAFIAQNQLVSATSTAGTPAAGTFYSSITNRASMVDLSQDLKPRMGIERLPVQSITLVQNEFGPNGEAIWVNANDIFGQIRFIGPGWESFGPLVGASVNGSGVFTTNSGDSVEVTFYGTGLNMLQYVTNSARTFNVSVDGGTAVGVTASTTSNSTVTAGRNTSPNAVLNLVSSLTLGIHTVKVTLTSGSDLDPSGFEILNQSSNVTVNPGVGYVNGKKLVTSAQSTFSYSAPVTGSRGGRVLVYQNSDGTIGQSFNAAGSQANLTSASHANEEVARVYSFREFGAGRADDFSLITTATSTDRAFTLEDGTTTLEMQQARTDTSAFQEGVFPVSSSNFFTITFVGTGLDLFCLLQGVATSTISVDGTNISTTYLNSIGNNTIVSGLPYGTHTVRFTRNSASAYFTWSKFTVYHPKTPTLPSGAVQLGTYNVLATYVANATGGATNLGTGVLRKYALREMTYSGTWTAQQATDIGGWQVVSTTNGDFVQYTFFGTGFDWRFTNAANISTWQFTLDASTNFTGITTSGYGTGFSGFVNSTGVLTTTATSTSANGFSVSGLTLGLHTIKIARVSGTGNAADITAMDIITPIHSQKSNIYADANNTLPVGSNAINDARKITPVKDLLTAFKSWSQAVGVASSPTTASTVFVPMPDMSCTISTTGQVLLDISYSASTFNSTGSQNITHQVYVDGIAVGTARSFEEPTAGFTVVIADRILVPVAPGHHKVDLYWNTSSGTLTANGIQRTLTVREN